MALVLTPLNGRLPAHMLRVVDGGRGPRGPQRLRLDAADAYDRCLRAGMPSGCLRSGYRTRAEQQAEVDRAKAGKTPVAAAPGRSYHGEGTAADVDEPARSWLHRHGAAYGWRGRLIKSEPWHFVYDPDYDQHRDTPTATLLEDTMRMIRRGRSGTTVLVDAGCATPLTDTQRDAWTAAGVPLTVLPEAQFDAAVSSLTAPLWRTTVARDGKQIPALQELADAKTLAAQAVALLKSQGTAAGVDVAALAEALAPLLAAAVRTGIDGATIRT